ncbi:MAG: peptidoglycan DD-metalloendopeptidase family protein [Chitinivibrionales bacterium]|nr:peptidoglycan DD-metalloendopeptidase family protein [Chitinivibrionales bacterium]MBD3357272.1 peptidoglycan DD-metalloendopeptidase family protein [Chitinivibrionales bacterium]
MKANYSEGRIARFPLMRSLFVLTAISISWYFCNHTTTEVTRLPPTHSIREAPSAPPPSPANLLSSYTVRSGDTFASALTKLGLSNAEAIEYYAPLESAGLTAIHPGDSIVLSTAADSTFMSLSYYYGMKCRYVLQRNHEGLRAEKWALSRSIHRAVVKGSLESSLSEDLHCYGVSDALVGKIAMILAWDINFFIDPRKGDQFGIIFEKEYVQGRFDQYGDVLAVKYVNDGRTHWAIGLADKEGRLDYYNLEGRSVQKQFLKAPLRFSRISSGYTHRRRHPILGIVRPHLGIDYAAPRGTPVYAAADGKITFVGTRGGYGKHIRIAHGDAFETYYGHLHGIARGISRDTQVRQGELIGTVGATGLATGPHLDYRMRRHGRFVNPLAVRLPSKEAVPPEAMDQFNAHKNACQYLLESRFIEDGQYTIDITNPLINGPTKVVTVARAENTNDKRVNSRDDS